jgi:hypothetical protein
MGTTKTKNVYIPFTYENGVNTATYNSFISAGYNENGTNCGVYLKDINTYVDPNTPTGPTYTQTTLSDFNYSTSGNTTYLNTYNGTYEYINLPTV